MTLGATLIISNWDKVGPVVKSVWSELDRVVQIMGGWEGAVTNISTLMAGVFMVNTVGSMKAALTTAQALSGVLGSIASLGTMTVSIGVAIYMFKKLNDIADAVTSKDQTGSFWDSLKQRWSAGGWYNNEQQLNSARSANMQTAKVNVSFDNPPPGMKVTPASTATPWLSYDVGYSRFSKP